MSAGARRPCSDLTGRFLVHGKHCALSCHGKVDNEKEMTILEINETEEGMLASGKKKKSGHHMMCLYFGLN